MAVATISRQALFEKVWTQPASKVASEYGVSETVLRRVCGRHDIPVPSSGYWNQVNAGHTFARPSLRPVIKPALELVTIVGASPAPRAIDAPPLRADNQAETIGQKAQPQAANVRPEPRDHEIEAEHPGLLPTRKALLRGKPDGQGFIRVAGRGLLPATVGPASVERTLAWLTDFLRMAEGRGARFHQKEERAVLICDGEEIAFRIEEKPERTPHSPTPAELTEKSKWGHIYSPTWTPWPKYDHSPSGRLALVIETNSYSGLRKTFGDGRSQTLEALSSDIFDAFQTHAALIKENRRKEEIARLEAEKAQRRRDRLKAFEEREARRLKFVAAVAEKLDERSQLAAVLGHIELQGDADREKLKDMGAWIRRRLTELDALLSP